MKSKNLRFLLFLLVALIVVFAIHIVVLYLLDSPLFANKIILSYTINYILAALLFVVIQSNFNKQATNTAFLFMLGSAFKFVVFFVVLYPSYQKDGVMKTVEFASFFLPYALCLTLEVLFLSKQLNNE